MTTHYYFWILGAIAIACMIVLAATVRADPVCMTLEQAKAGLETRYGEMLFGHGKFKNLPGETVLFLNPQTRTWTQFVLQDKKVCVIFTGTDWLMDGEKNG